jgi:hypothetical protein
VGTVGQDRPIRMQKKITRRQRGGDPRFFETLQCRGLLSARPTSDLGRDFASPP